MANAGPNTNGSQFFIVSGPSGVGLPPQYSLFGQVVKGLDIVDADAARADRRRRQARRPTSSSTRSPSPSPTDVDVGVGGDVAELSHAQARRLALGAQGFTDPRPTGRVDRRHLRRVVDRMGLIQIDSVNVLVRSQELPLFARLGPHPRTLIGDASRDGELFEYWVHEACHVPVAPAPVPAVDDALAIIGGRPSGDLRRRRPEFIDEVRIRIRDEGPLVAGDLNQRVGPKGTWWDWDDGKIALEHLFYTGEVAALRRPNDFARVYDLAEPGDPRRHPGAADTARDRRPQGAARAGGPAPRRRDVRGPHRLPPPAQPAVPSAHRASWSRRVG